jgi:hypothetical protein
MMKFIIYTLIFVFVPIVCFAASPNSFLGTYETSTRDNIASFLVIDKESLSIDECKKLPYKTIESSKNNIVIDVKLSKACSRKIIKIERREEQMKVESKGHPSDIPTILRFIVTIFKNYDDVKTNKPLETRRYMRVDPSKANDQVKAFLTGKTGKKREEALHEINLQGYENRDKYNEIGLRDHSPNVRKTAVWFLRGEPNHFVPLLINVMVHDQDAKVRASAGFSLSHFYTDNGSDDFLYIKPLEDNLDKLLMGLKNVETMRSVVEILGNRYTGRSFAPCYMSIQNKEKIIEALKEQLIEINLVLSFISHPIPWKREWNEAEMKRETGDRDKINTYGEATNEIRNAIENISKCNLENNQSN